ncbi:tubulin gamma-chain (gamma-tubulin), putative [Theileria annulata]|uniref:Tubulin gamma chain n=1 Tax=Theileria annulata TaxID=5874 RepID=Q4UCK3_THEAN|nr:tubulin gamma-chain (gamma-tubulin), putative [Theileria annulata]CAI75448.1 tubulin gamma-chain (gamma-tubulin), putative [Theileria annulata]|eukprot:XP_954924.1 tubulin gamma-chain (gamma-tubulin), putative [Theileria annulata]
MTKEIVTLHVGQCGNNIGNEFWNQICLEHGINKDGFLLDKTPIGDDKDVFFFQTGTNRYYPRALLIDLEPRVISSILNSENKNLFNPENVFLSKDSMGAGNNWGVGYTYGNQFNDELSEIVDREVDNADNLEGFVLSHSIGGGTGSGLGSYLLEMINENYPKKLIKTFSVFPQLKKSSDVVVQPYNTILSLKRLILNADLVNVIDNNVVNNHSFTSDNLLSLRSHNSNNNSLKENSTSFEENSNSKEKLQYNNKLVMTYKYLDYITNFINIISKNIMNIQIGNIMSSVTSCIRFPGPINNDLISLVSSLVIIPRCHFLISSIMDHENITLLNLVKKLYYPNNFLVYTSTKNGKYLSALNIIRGNNINPSDVYKCIEKIKEKRLVEFIKWNPANIQVNLIKQSPHKQDKTNGILVANHTSINQVFEDCILQFDKLYSRRAFLDNYRKAEFFSREDGKGDFEEMEHSREVVELVKEEYIRSQQDDYYDLSCK